MESSLLNQIFSALNILALELTADHKLQAIGKIPDWINQEFEHLHLETAAFEAEQMSSFLSNFLIDAAAFWSQVSASLSLDEISSQMLRSGVWTETGRSGKDIHLEAIALQLDDSIRIILWSSRDRKSVV